MDITLLFKAGMRNCGRVLRVLPKKEIGSPIEYMTNILKEVTLPKLNILLPQLVEKTFPVGALTQVDDGDNVFKEQEFMSLLFDDAKSAHGMDSRYAAFRVPKTITDGSDIMGLKNWHLTYSTPDMGENNIYGFGLGEMYPNRYGRFSSANIYARSVSGIINYADAQLMGTMVPSLRLKFYQPNILLVNKPYGNNPSTFMTVTFKLKNDENLMTISDNSYEAVREMFVLDLKASIYGEYGIFDEVETTTGNSIRLGISDWSSAEQDAAQLYKDNLATAHFRNSSMMSG